MGSGTAFGQPRVRIILFCALLVGAALVYVHRVRTEAAESVTLLQSQVERLSADASNKEQSSSSCQAERLATERALADSKRAAEKSATAEKQCRDETAALATEVKTLKGAQTTLDGKLTTANGNLKSLENRLDKSEELRTAAERLAATGASEVEELKKKLNASELKLKSTTSELESAKAALNKAQFDLESTSKEHVADESQALKLSEQLKLVQDALEAQQMLNKENGVANAKIASEMEILREMNKKCSSSKQSRKSHVDDVEEQLLNLLKEQQATTERLASIQSAVKKIKEANDELLEA